ncbi:MAG: NDP-sugar synthase [Candidatus Bathyarchaeia archaeon]
MKALILAGGFGTRLRPLTCTRPKLMFPVANRPLLDWIIERLSQSGVDVVVLAVNYMADVFARSFGKSKYGVKIRYSRETKPLGTGGPIKKAKDLLNGDDEPFFVLNGDILSTIDYKALYKKHAEYGAKATIALHEVENPSRFGLAMVNDKNQILKFIEKPKPEVSMGKLINAGVYVLNQSVFELIPPDRQVSIEKEVFPILAESGGLYGYNLDGLWVDIGKPEDYILANRYMLNMVAPQNHIEKGAKISNRASIVPPVALAKGVTIEQDAVVGPYVSVGEGVTIGRGTRIENSILFSNALVDYSTSIKSAIIGEGAIIGRWVKIENDCIVGDHAVIDDNVTLVPNVKICPSKQVSDSILQASTVM